MFSVDPLDARPTLFPGGPDVSLPGWIYGSSEFFDLESKHIFAPAWSILCHISEIPKAGDYQTMEIFGERLFAIRDADDRIRVFYNVCRHRGHPVVTGESGNCRSLIRCPYHSWTYQLDGRLRGVAQPDRMVKFDKATFGLKELESEIFLGFVWFRFASGGMSVRDRFAPVADELRSLSFDKIEPYRAPNHYDLGCDWKAVMDNFNECYHCPTGHPSLTALFDSKTGTEDVYDTRLTRQWGDIATNPIKHWSGRIYQRTLPENPFLPPDYRRRWLYYALYPLVWIDIQPDQIDYVQLLPQGPGRTLARGNVYTHGDYSREMEAARFAANRINASTQREDDAFTREIQRGLLSNSYTAGLLSKEEKLVVAWQRWIREDLPVAGVIDRPPSGGVHRLNEELRQRRAGE